METIKLDIDQHQIYVEKVGTGTPILLINGLGGNPKNLEKLRENLGNYQIITYDPPGVGKSSDLSWPIRISSHAKIASKVLDSLNIKTSVIFGVSWGGAVAQEMAFQNPSLVSHLVLVSTTPGPFLIVKPSVLSNRYIKMITSPKSEWMQIAAIFGWTSLNYLGKIQQPTLIVSGTGDDLVLPYNSRLLNWIIPNSELKLIEDNHWLVINNSDTLASMIHDFLNN